MCVNPPFSWNTADRFLTLGDAGDGKGVRTGAGNWELKSTNFWSWSWLFRSTCKGIVWPESLAGASPTCCEPAPCVAARLTFA